MKLSIVQLHTGIRFSHVETTRSIFLSEPPSPGEFSYAIRYEAPFIWITQVNTGLEIGVPLSNVVSFQKEKEAIPPTKK